MDNVDMSALNPADVADVFPIGKSSGFLGYFNGNGKTIDKLTVSNTSTSGYAGLFGLFSGIITRLGVTNANITGTGSCPGSYCMSGGIIAGEFYGTMMNCYATGTVTADDAGGLVGSAPTGFLFNTYAIANVNGTTYAGGVTGVPYYPDVYIQSTFSVGTVTVNPGNDASSAGAITPEKGSIPAGQSDWYFDQDLGCTNDCDGAGTGVDVSLQPGYFFSPLNPPLTDWDFTNVWQSGASYPTLR
jgi:hypothetical protein